MADNPTPSGERRIRHDRDACPICYQQRVIRLRRRGLPFGLLRQLDACGVTLGRQQLAALETASDADCASVAAAFRSSEGGM